MPNLANHDYVDRINRAIDYVMRNLGEPLDLKSVAKVACFSPHHFHRIFGALLGETLNAFVKRVRLERAIVLMSHRDASLTDIALRCGFSSSSDFSRSFRAAFGVPPSAFDVAAYRRTRRADFLDVVKLTGLPPGENPDGFRVRVRDLPPRRVAYLRVLRPYEGRGVVEAAERLVAWAQARGLAGGQWLGYQWDDPEIVPLELCRYDVGIEIPRDAPLGDDVSVVTFPAMRVAEVDVVGSLELELRALDWLFKTWLPRSGYAPDHHPCFEAWNGLPFAHGFEHFELRAHLPIVDAAAPL